MKNAALTKGRFCISARQNKAKSSDRLTAMPGPRVCKILIVASDADVGKILTTRFAIFGFQATAMSDVKAAWAVLGQKTEHSILITDSPELLEQCKSRDLDLPQVFFIIDESLQQNPETYFALGADGCIQKPFDARTLLSTARVALLGREERLRHPLQSGPKETIELEFSSFQEAQNSGAFALGRGGFFLKTTTPFSAQNVFVNFNFNFGHFQLSGLAICRWQRVNGDNTSMIGCELRYLKPESMPIFIKWLAENPVRPFIPSPLIKESLPQVPKRRKTG